MPLGFTGKMVDEQPDAQPSDCRHDNSKIPRHCPNDRQKGVGGAIGNRLHKIYLIAKSHGTETAGQTDEYRQDNHDAVFTGFE